MPLNCFQLQYDQIMERSCAIMLTKNARYICEMDIDLHFRLARSVYYSIPEIAEWLENFYRVFLIHSVQVE
jgi:hypothetical protein